MRTFETDHLIERLKASAAALRGQMDYTADTCELAAKEIAALADRVAKLEADIEALWQEQAGASL